MTPSFSKHRDLMESIYEEGKGEVSPENVSKKYLLGELPLTTYNHK